MDNVDSAPVSSSCSRRVYAKRAAVRLRDATRTVVGLHGHMGQDMRARLGTRGARGVVMRRDDNERDSGRRRRGTTSCVSVVLGRLPVWDSRPRVGSALVSGDGIWGDCACLVLVCLIFLRRNTTCLVV